MARPPRLELAGGIHHVWNRGNRRQLVFPEDDDCRRYLELLACVVRRRWWSVLAFCLMRNHVHLLIQTPVPNLGKGMQYLQGQYATDFNERHDLVGQGHLWQGRYKNRLIETDEDLYGIAAYIARNPVEAGLSERAEQWRWGSHALIATGSAPTWLDTERLAEYFGSLNGYVAFVDQVPTTR